MIEVNFIEIKVGELFHYLRDYKVFIGTKIDENTGCCFYTHDSFSIPSNQKVWRVK